MKKTDLFLGVFLGAVSLFYLWQTYLIPSGNHILNSSRSFPMLLGVLLLLLAILLIGNSLRQTKEERKPAPLNWSQVKRGIFFVILFTVYILLGISLLGYLLATFLYMLVGIYYFREMKWYGAVGVSAGTLLFIYFALHQLMYIRLP